MEPNLTASQTTRIARRLLMAAENSLWTHVKEVLGPDDDTEVTDADLKRIFNALKALI
jgi:1,2-phenylacetyl-CoA epoxidase catalytic subunit